MSQNRHENQPLIKIVIPILGFILLVLWFYFDREFEPLVAILIALEGFLLWLATRNPKYTIPTIIFAILVFIIGVILILQQKNARTNVVVPIPSQTIVEVVTQPILEPENTPIPPNETPSPIILTDTPNPTDTVEKPTRPPITPTSSAPSIRVRSNSALSSLMPVIEDLPPNMKQYKKDAFSDKEMALDTEFPADFYLQLAEWGSQGGYVEVYDIADICDASAPYQIVATKIYLTDSEQGAIDLYEWMYNDIREKSQIYNLTYWDQQDSTIGDRGFEYRGDVLLCLGVESSLYHRIVFQRYNAIVTVDVTGFDSQSENHSFSSWSKRLANIIDINIAAEANG